MKVTVVPFSSALPPISFETDVTVSVSLSGSVSLPSSWLVTSVSVSSSTVTSSSVAVGSSWTFVTMIVITPGFVILGFVRSYDVVASPNQSGAGVNT